jgi:DNA-binding NarL/FixJ family response regulator
MIRVMIADDHNLVRQGIRALLEKGGGIEVVGETQDGIETLENIIKKRPDVLVMDISMPNLSGIQVLERVKTERIDLNVVILSMYSDDQLIRQAMKLGAKAYLLKNSLKEELISAIQAAHKREIFCNSLVSSILEEPVKLKQSEGFQPLDLLTTREKEVLKLIAEGNTNAATAGILHLSIKTVEKHRSNLLEKLKVQDTASLIRLAIKYHLIFIDESHLQ